MITFRLMLASVTAPNSTFTPGHMYSDLRVWCFVYDVINLHLYQHEVVGRLGQRGHLQTSTRSKVKNNFSVLNSIELKFSYTASNVFMRHYMLDKYYFIIAAKKKWQSHQLWWWKNKKKTQTLNLYGLKHCRNIFIFIFLKRHGHMTHCREHAFIRETNRTKAQAEHIKVVDRKWHHSLAYPDCAVTENKGRRNCTPTPYTVHITHHRWKRWVRLQHSKRKIIKL